MNPNLLLLSSALFNTNRERLERWRDGCCGRRRLGRLQYQNGMAELTEIAWVVVRHSQETELAGSASDGLPQMAYLLVATGGR